MSDIKFDTSGVHWPQTPAVKAAMESEIRRFADEQGYTHFATMTLRCLNGIESPDPDPEGPPGWNCLKFYHDCEPHLVDDECAVFPDVRLFAKKDT